MSDTKTKTPKMVEITVPRGSSKEDPNLYVSVNGKSYLIPRGKTVSVPAAVAYEYNRSLRAQNSLYDKKDEMIKKGQEPEQQPVG